MIVARGHDGADTGEMRRMRDRGKHLRCANVRPAPHTDLAVGIRKGRRPFHGIITVLGFVLEHVPLPFGGVAAAHILDDHDVASYSTLQSEADAAVLVIRGTLQKYRKPAIRLRAEDIGVQGDAVPCFHRNIAFEGDCVGIGTGGADDQSGENQKEQQEPDSMHSNVSLSSRR